MSATKLEWVGKCSMSAFNDTLCNVSPSNPKDNTIVKLIDCQRPVINHLRQLKLTIGGGSDFVFDSKSNSTREPKMCEGFLISCRIGQFRLNPNLTVCPLHRDKLGRLWSPSIDCQHPDHKRHTWTHKINAHGTGLQLYNISVAMSEYVLCEKGYLVPVGSGMCLVCFDLLLKEMSSKIKSISQETKCQIGKNDGKPVKDTTAIPISKSKKPRKRQIVTVGAEKPLGPRKKKKRVFEGFILTDEKKKLSATKKKKNYHIDSQTRANFVKRMPENQGPRVFKYCDHTKRNNQRNKKYNSGLKCGLFRSECNPAPKNDIFFCVFCRREFPDINQFDNEPCIKGSQKHGIYYTHIFDKANDLCRSKSTLNATEENDKDESYSNQINDKTQKTSTKILKSVKNDLENMKVGKETQILVDVKEKLEQMVTFIRNQEDQDKCSPIKFFRVSHEKSYVPCDLRGKEMKTELPSTDMTNDERLEPYPVSIEIASGMESESSCLRIDTHSINKQFSPAVEKNIKEVKGHVSKVCEPESMMYVINSESQTNELSEPYPVAMGIANELKMESFCLPMDVFSNSKQIAQSSSVTNENILTIRSNSQFCVNFESENKCSDNCDDQFFEKQNVLVETACSYLGMKQEPVEDEKIKNGNPVKTLCKSEQIEETCLNKNENLKMITTTSVKQQICENSLSVKQEPMIETNSQQNKIQAALSLNRNIRQNQDSLNCVNTCTSNLLNQYTSENVVKQESLLETKIQQDRFQEILSINQDKNFVIEHTGQANKGYVKKDLNIVIKSEHSYSQSGDIYNFEPSDSCDTQSSDIENSPLGYMCNLQSDDITNRQSTDSCVANYQKSLIYSVRNTCEDSNDLLHVPYHEEGNSNDNLGILDNSETESTLQGLNKESNVFTRQVVNLPELGKVTCYELTGTKPDSSSQVLKACFNVKPRSIVKQSIEKPYHMYRNLELEERREMMYVMLWKDKFKIRGALLPILVYCLPSKSIEIPNLTSDGGVPEHKYTTMEHYRNGYGYPSIDIVRGIPRRSWFAQSAPECQVKSFLRFLFPKLKGRHFDCYLYTGYGLSEKLDCVCGEHLRSFNSENSRLVIMPKDEDNVFTENICLNVAKQAIDSLETNDVAELI